MQSVGPLLQLTLIHELLLFLATVVNDANPADLAFLFIVFSILNFDDVLDPSNPEFT